MLLFMALQLFYLCGVGIFSDLDFGADALNALSTNVWFNIIFFILVVFASSFWVLSIMLPNSWANKVDNQADRGGIIGILFMALALAMYLFVYRTNRRNSFSRSI
jgi:thiol:disulfide interchange protein DsbD